MQLPPFLSCSQPMAVVSSNCIPSLTLGSLSQLGRRSLGCLSLSLKLTHLSNSSLHCSLNVPENTHEDTPMEKRFPPYPTVMDINQIRERLPHRFPFLLVDRIIEYNPGVSVVGIKNVTINDNFFPGHFPERPIMPGVLMIEAMSQVGGAVILEPDVKGTSGEVFFLAGVDKVRFRKPVIPGDTLVMRMSLMKMHKRFGVAKLEGKAYVGSELVCEGEFLMATGSDPQARFLYP